MTRNKIVLVLLSSCIVLLAVALVIVSCVFAASVNGKDVESDTKSPICGVCGASCSSCDENKKDEELNEGEDASEEEDSNDREDASEGEDLNGAEDSNDAEGLNNGDDASDGEGLSEGEEGNDSSGAGSNDNSDTSGNNSQEDEEDGDGANFGDSASSVPPRGIKELFINENLEIVVLYSDLTLSVFRDSQIKFADTIKRFTLDENGILTVTLSSNVVVRCAVE